MPPRIIGRSPRIVILRLPRLALLLIVLAFIGLAAARCAFGPRDIAPVARDPVAVLPVFLPAESAPPFTLLDSAGGETSSESWADRPYSLVFWAAWCAECPAVVENVAAVHSRAEGTDRILAAAVNVAEPIGAAQAFAADRGWSLPLFYDPEGAAALALGVGLLPGIVVVDDGGVVRERLFGPVSADTYAARLQSALP